MPFEKSPGLGRCWASRSGASKVLLLNVEDEVQAYLDRASLTEPRP